MSDGTLSAAKLEKQLRMLERKLERSEWHRVDLENQHDRDQHLYRRLQADLEAAKREAEIAAALERVRSRAMAMRTPKDLSDISETIFTELKALGFADLRNTEIIINHEAGSFIRSYYYSDYGVSGVIDIDYRTNPIVDAWAREMQTADDAFSEVVIREDEIEEWRYYRLSQGYAPDPKLDAASVVYHYSYSIGPGALSISSFEPVAAQQLDVLAQFRNVFHLAYQRYADIARAEAQAREAQIQLALERVRTQSMLMQHSSELVATSAVFHEQLLALGIATEFSYVWLPDEAAGKHQFWATWTSEEDDGPVHRSRAVTYDLDRSEPYTAACFAAWESDERLFVDFIPPADVEGFLDAWPDLLEDAEHMRPEHFPDGLYYAEGYMEYGCFGIDIRREPTEIEREILRRFAVEFERAYTRFLDLRRAEAQAREAEIEAALERVRSRTMAMHKPEELQGVVSVVAEELQRLDIIMDAGGVIICTYFPDSRDVVHWLSAPDFSSSKPYLLPYFDHPIFNAAWASREKGDDFFSQAFPVEEKNSFFRHAFEHSDYRYFPEDFKEWILVTEHHALTFAWSKHSALLIPSFTDIFPSEADRVILKRFARVFEQAYTRYLDLEQAEANAREAQIEAALERLRSRTMAMQSSDELADVVARIFDELTRLDLDLTRCVIWVIDPETRNARFWMANQEQPDAPESYFIPYHDHPSYRAFLDAWDRRDKVWVYDLHGDLKTTWDEVLFTETELSRLPPDVKAGMRAPDRVVLTAAFTSFGAFHAAGLEPLSDESTAILRRFAKVFEQTYTRFLDLNQAEEQAREARIEAALERVRSRTMAMRSSDDLPQAANLLFEQIHALGMPAWSAGYCIWDDDRRGITLWMSSEGVLQPPFHAPLTEDPCFMGMREGYDRGVPLHVHDMGGDELVEHYEYMRALPVVGEILDSMIEAGHPLPSYQINHCAYFSHGFLLFITYEPVPEAHSIFERFAKVFEQTYTRYLDLKRAEAQARESQIEAAMERVRSRALAMTTSDELLEVVFRIHREFSGLGLECGAFWHTRYTPECYQKALTSVDGQKLAAIMELPRDFSSNPALAAWERGDEKIGVFRFDADAGSQYLHHMVTKGRFSEVDPEAITEEMVREHGGLTFVQARTSHGEIGYSLWGEAKPSEEAKDVLVRFAGAFDLAYRRFEDLQQAERQAALDRVRAEIAAMLTSDAHVSGATFDPLAAEIRTLFGRSDLRLGLATLQADGSLNVRPGRPVWNSLVIRDALLEGTLDWRGTLYETAMQGSEALAVSDVESDGSLDEELREHLLDCGVRSLALQPLRTADRTVGLLELSSPEAGAVDASSLLTMKGLESTFALAVTQNLEWFETRVESAIQHAYTAIHPSVRWRFRQAAIERLERGDGTAEPEPVVFEAVHPLYGAADIRSSTHHRNEAVRHDVLGRLGRARDALAAIYEALPLTILDELGLRLRKRIEQYERVWNTGDEAIADRFLTEDVEPVLKRMTAGRADLATILEAHQASDEEGAVLRSDAYEASRRAINRAVADLLLAEEAETQRLFPHYLELTRTDGVEHTMYIGPSMAPDRPFDLAYVENLRLRQLLTACAVARGVGCLGETLPMPLAIAQLIIVQHDPVTLRFRPDEKRFDVDSPSGVRFELLKKRLDKACVKGTDERITQPDQIAVVYSTEAEEAEYRRYADYLAAQEHIEPEPERLEVEDLPDAAGLKMLRLTVSSGAP